MARRKKNKETVMQKPSSVKEPDNKINDFQTAKEDGTAAQFRFSNARSVRSIFERLRDSDLKAADLRSRIRRAYDGLRPFNPKKLAAMGLKHSANINTMGLKGQIDARVAVVQDMALDTTDLVELRPVAGNQAGPVAERVAAVVSREFSSTLRSSRRFLNAVTSLVKESELYGMGPLTWPDYKDYEPIALECGQVKYWEEASSVSSENDLYMIESPINAGYLYRLTASQEAVAAATAEGWNVPVIRRLLISQFVEGRDPHFAPEDSTQTSAVESAIARWRQNRDYDEHQFQSANVIHTYAREVSGSQKITHYMVGANGEEEEEFLFRRPEAYDNMDQCMVWLTYTAGERYARALRGLASYLLPMEDVSNRLLCRQLDAVWLASGLILNSSTAARQRRLTIYEHGPYTVLPDDVTPAQSQVTPKFQELSAVREGALSTAYNNATGARGPAAISEQGYSGADRKTKDQIRMEASAGNRVEKSLFVLRSTIFDAIFRECFRRFMKLVVDSTEHDHFPAVPLFIERCKRQQVGMDELRNLGENFTMYMCRDLVTGGAGAKGDSIEQILSVSAGNFDERGIKNLTSDLVRSRLGQQAVDRYIPPVSRDKMPSDAASFAQVENNEIEELHEILVASDQMHWAHVNIHGQLIQKLMQQVQQGEIEDPQRMLDVMQSAAEHIREHLVYGARQTGMKGKAKQVEGGLRSLAPYIKMLTMQAAAIQKQRDAQMRQQQKEQQDLNDRADGKDNAVKVHEIDTNASLKMREQDLNHQVKMVGVGNQAAADEARVKSQNQLAAIKVSADRLINAGSITGNRPPNPEAISGNQPRPAEETSMVPQ